MPCLTQLYQRLLLQWTLLPCLEPAFMCGQSPRTNSICLVTHMLLLCRSVPPGRLRPLLLGSSNSRLSIRSLM